MEEEYRDNYEMFKIEILTQIFPENENPDDLTRFMNSLDEIAQKYTIKLKSTDLITVSNDDPDVLKYFLVAKAIEGLSPATLQFYRITLKNFFLKMNKAYTDITTNDIRVYLFQYKEERNV